MLGTEKYPIVRTSKRKLRQVNFLFEGNEIRGLEQNPDTKSRWVAMARVMQFIVEGRYIAVVVDGGLTFRSACVCHESRICVPWGPTMTGIGDWAQKNWFELSILLMQASLLAIVVWYGSKILRFLTAFFEYQNEFRQRLSATIDQVPADGSGIELVWREVKEWLQAPMGSGGAVDPLGRIKKWIRARLG